MTRLSKASFARAWLMKGICWQSFRPTSIS